MPFGSVAILLIARRSGCSFAIRISLAPSFSAVLTSLPNSPSGFGMEYLEQV
jgi:hypothetical protein